MSGEFSREALRARVGDELFDYAERAADAAPPPSPELVERLRLVFAPVLARMDAHINQPPSRAAA